MKKALAVVVIIIIAVVVGLWWSNSASAPQNDNTRNTNTKTISNNKEPGFNKSQYSLTNPASLWVVVNKDRPLNPINYAPSDLISVGNGQEMRSQAASALKTMIAAAGKQGVNFYPFSGYRSYDTQVAAYNSEVSAFGTAKADAESARPGYSEHQTGWAVDLGTSGCQIGACFANTTAGKWLAANAYEYGFLLRYPEGYQNVTGYEYEPWHFRYIGDSLAAELHKTGIKTLEQFFGLPNAPNYN